MKIVVGITGGIAAYKSPELVRLLVKAGHEVRCAATEHALRFTTRETLETVSRNRLYFDLFSGNEESTAHISLKDWAELLVVAPATANIIGKTASGIADDALSTLLLAFDPRKVLLAPAMNSMMWQHPAVRRNMQTLLSWGMQSIGPMEGDLACGTSGAGRMAEPAEIAEAVCRRAEASDREPIAEERKERWLVTAGPTYERIDAVRFIGNYSSGKMGFALAEALAKRGFDVELVSGPTALHTTSPRIHRTDVESAQQMFDAATALFPHCHGAILSAAVADYRPQHCADHKLKKKGDEGMRIDLIQNPDILATLGTMKQEGQTLVGFALETDNEQQNAEEKLRRKNLDYIVLNSLRDPGAGFGTDTNRVLLISREGPLWQSDTESKTEVAQKIIERVCR